MAVVFSMGGAWLVTGTALVERGGRGSLLGGLEIKNIRRAQISYGIRTRSARHRALGMHPHTHSVMVVDG